jgi:hypothetical protein
MGLEHLHIPASFSFAQHEFSCLLLRKHDQNGRWQHNSVTFLQMSHACICFFLLLGKRKTRVHKNETLKTIFRSLALP